MHAEAKYGLGDILGDFFIKIWATFWAIFFIKIWATFWATFFHKRARSP
jgi:hypothetical protein